MLHFPRPMRRARTGCSVLALATVLVVGASPAAAQSFLGVGTPTNGAATTITNGSGTTTISVTAPQTVINWVPTDNASGGAASNTPIVFQNSGTTASFLGAGNYAVLNNINMADTSRIVSMNGTITAGALGAAAAANGSIYFYSPSGFVIGGSSVINVGSLVLSASPILVDGSGNFINGSSNQVIFGQALSSGSRIVTNSGSQINATAADAYVAMVAPRVQHGGTINVAGSAALVGAEAAVINFSPDGLFDIQVNTGTTDANGVAVQGGTITGPASTGAADIHRAYLVAVPKNTALTLAINQGGSLGFDIAGAANVVGNTVVLSAGHDVVDGVSQTFKSVAGGNNAANLSVAATNVTSAVNAVASGFANLFAATGSTSNYASNVSIRAFDHVFVNANATSTLNIAGNLTMTANHDSTGVGSNNTGGFVALYASVGGTVNITGNATVQSIGYGGSSLTPGVSAGSGTGGPIWVQSEGNSTLAIGGNLSATASGQGGSAGAVGANAGNATGGQILVRTFGTNSVLTVGGNTNAHAGANAGNATTCVGCAGSGGTGTGGTVSITTAAASGNVLTLAGTVSLSASGQGGSSSSGGAGGQGQGGSIAISAGTGSTLALNNSAVATASGFGGSGSSGGAGTGGSVSVTSNAILNIAGYMNAFAEGAGGTGQSAAAGAGQGGTITFKADNGGDLNLNGNLFASADGRGGHAGGSGADGGDGSGGTIAFYATGAGSTIDANGANLQANGTGGRGDGLECFSCDGDGGDGAGGDVFVGDGYFFSALSSGNSIDFAGFLTMTANGTGGTGVGASGNGSGGSAELSWYGSTTGSVGGNVTISAIGRGGDNYFGGIAGNGDSAGFGAIISPDGGLIVTGNVSLDATGYGGSTFTIGGGTGGTGDGGVARLFNGVGTITISGNVTGHADGIGGAGYLGSGGDGIGGLATINAFDSAISIGGQARLYATAAGGNGGGSSSNFGGDATGGTARIVTTSGTVSIAAAANLDASGNGGDAGTGGIGGGGSARISADGSGSSITISGATTVSANASGGDSNSEAGANATGGDVDIYAQNGGNLLFDDNLTVSADATGGAGATGGGYAQGGTPSIYSLATLKVDGTLTATANATGGLLYGTDSDGYSAGDAKGGHIDVYAQSGLLTVVGAATLSTDATGGAADNFGDFSGDGTGGETWLFANAGGTIDLQSTLDVTAIGSGGGSTYYGSGIGGNGEGGSVRVQATATSSRVTVAGAATLDASGEGSDSSGGNGKGGKAWADSFGASTAKLEFLSDVSVYAQGSGGDHNNANGGNGQGGEALLQASAGSTLTVGGNATVNSDAFGGYSYDFSDGIGGNAVGGTARIQAFTGTGTPGTIDIEGSATVSANGSGGDSYSFFGGVGGNGTGGLAQLYATPGLITIGNAQTEGGATVSANGEGGYSQDGTGGNGTGGTLAEIAAVNGDLIIAGYASVSANGTGGDGVFGGHGLGSGDTSDPDVVNWTGGAHIYARNGDIVIGGGAGVSATGTGGDGDTANGYGGEYGGDGGNGTGGWASIHAANSALGASLISIVGGQIEGSGVATVSTNGTGGDGGNGYEGDDGNYGGDGANGIDGEDGGLGGNGGDGGNGGNGGNGIGGRSTITASADNGHVVITDAVATAMAVGGVGGSGGNGGTGGNGGVGGTAFEGSGGNGGDGGNGGLGGLGGIGGSAIGGIINLGTESGNGSAFGLAQGDATYGTISLNVSATGGGGGNGGFGGFGGTGGAPGTGISNGAAGTAGVEGAIGNGGNGGDATAGAAVLLVRGSTVTAGTTTLIANATGGNAGDGPGSTGGDATIGGDGGIDVLVTERFQNTGQRGTLNAGDITGISIATAGTGESNGTSQGLGGNVVVFRNSDGTLGSLDFLIQADTIGAGAIEDAVAVHPNGTVTVAGAFNFVTSGELSLLLDNATLTAETIKWHAADFVPDTVTVTPVVAGTFFAQSFDIQTGNNFVTTAHLDSVQTLSIIAPGAIQIGNVTGDADIILNAQGAEVDIGTVLGGGGIDIDAADFIFAGNITGNGVIDLDAGSSIQVGSILNTGNTSLFAGSSINVGAINSGSGAVSLITDAAYIIGDVVVGGSIYADSGSDLFLGNLTAPGDIELYAVSDMMIGNATAGETIDLEAGGYVDGDTMTAGDSVYVQAGNYVELLNISAGIVDQSLTEGVEYNVGILSGGTIDTGDIAAANSIGLGAVDDIYTGSIDAENIFLALGGGDMSFGEINSGGTTYLADDGMIALGGDPSEGDFDPAPILAAIPVVSGGSITLRGPVTAGRFVAAASGAISGSTIDSDTSIYTANGGNVTLTDLDAGTSIFQRSNGIITENDLTAGTFIDIRSAGGLALGDLIAGDYIDLRSNGAIGLGNATSGETINFLSGSTLTGGDMTAGNAVLAETMGAIQLGNVTAGITDPSAVPGADYAARFSSGGAITIGNVNALGRIGFGTPTTLLTGNLTSGDGLSALVGGDMSLGTINVDDYVYLANYSMSALGGAFPTFDLTPILGSSPVATGGSITLRGPVSAGSFYAAAGTFVDGGSITSDNNISIEAGTDITLGDLFAGQSDGVLGDSAIRFRAGGLIEFDNAIAIDDIDLEAVGSIIANDITSGQGIHAEAGGAIEFESLSAGLVNPQPLDPDDDVAIGIRSLTSIAVGSVNSAESVGFVSLGSLDTGPITTGGDVIALAGGYIELGTVNAGGRVYLANASIYQALEDLVGEEDVSAEDIFNSTLVATGGSILTGPITAGRLQAAAGTTMWIDGDIDSDTSVDLSSGGAMQLENVTAGSTIRLTSGATIDGGDLTAGSDVRVAAVGAVDVGDITIESGIEVIDGFTTQDVGSGTPVEVFGASITTGNISTDGYVGLYTPGDLQVGTIDAGHDVIALVGDDAAFGAIDTPEHFFLGGYEMYALVTGGEGFNPEAVFDAATKSATDGSATFAGSSSAGNFEAYVGDDTTVASLHTDNGALIETGGLFSLTGALDGRSEILSNDINIGSGASITGSEVALVSRNANQTLIGDGLDGLGAGYRLSDAEFDRIRTNIIMVGADTAFGAAPKMIIGDLSYAPGANDFIDEIGFLVGNGETETSAGTILIKGNVTFNNLLNSELVYFTSETFELDAATGSISLYGQGTTLGGRLELDADRVWVASETILAKLRANPLYAGRVAELNAPAAVQRPEGVIRAEAIEFGEDQAPSSLLVQNTGTTATPAGFLLNAASIGSDEEGGEIPPGAIDLVINGQVITESGTASGIAVRDGLVTEFGTEIFVAGSTINGCVLVGPCITTNPRPPVVETVKPTDVQLADGSGLGDGLFGNEPDIDDGESGDEGDMSSPIVAPVPLFDSRPLTASGDIDDPVSGAGNPSLYGHPSDDEAPECDSSKDGSCKTGQKGDGK